ncbi:MAG: hypothetical protein SGJ13_16325 [Actinomycetota bacterium]|nr:hypothetical protein [Actinomycetota bacterium]
MRRAVKRAVGAGVIAGMGYAVWRAWKAQMPDRTGDVSWETAPFPFPPVPRPAPSAARPAEVTKAATQVAVCVDPIEGGACPTSHPVKAKTSSGIFHVPGGANYERTKADRCYVDADAAEADGLRPSKH